MKKKAFTLIELIAILVILAILALIVTPLVMNIIKKARNAADKRSIDAYGRSVELAIASYLLDNGDFPKYVSQLTVEYSGDEVVCSTLQLNSDSTVYLAGCTVSGRSVDYTYGKEEAIIYNAYSIGDEVSYNNIDYYVIKDSGTDESSVTLLKAEPLTVDEVNLYGTGYVNKYTYDLVGTSYNKNGYGGVAYYSSETCGFVNSNIYISTDCITDYADSDIKHIVDAWSNSNISENDLVEARLITLDDLKNNLGYEYKNEGGLYPSEVGKTPSFVYNNSYDYWTMSQYDKHSSTVLNNGNILDITFGSYYYVVRPVITIKKSALSN